jgi:hypothetical protein
MSNLALRLLAAKAASGGGGSHSYFTGGVESTDGPYTVHTFAESGTLTFVDVDGPVSCEVLVVAGGGGGSSGGGGGGGVLTSSALNVGATQVITVGGGGAAGSGRETGSNGSNGGASSIGSLVSAVGGGGGGRAEAPGVAGGSGGGGGAHSTNASNLGGAGTAGQGFAGGRNAFTPSPFVAGGGGGAGAVGSDGASSSVAGAGGAGVASSISGTSVTYGGGGGGGTYSTGGTGGAGGTGGGVPGTSGVSNGGTAPANRGAGGGGGGGGVGHLGTAGGSGIVIVRYIPGTQFQPDDISGLAAWYDPSDAATVTESGGLVSALNDKSGNARHLSASGGQRPKIGVATLGGGNVLTWDTAGMFMSHDAGSNSINLAPFTFFAVVRGPGGLASQSRRIFATRQEADGQDFNIPNVVIYRAPANTQMELDVLSTGRNFPTPFPAVANNTWAVAVGKANATEVRGGWGNGFEQARGGSALPAIARHLRLGGQIGTGFPTPGGNANESWVGDIAEVVIYNATLTPAQEASVKLYLSDKWGVTL